MSNTNHDIAQVMNVDNQDWFLQSLINIVNSEEITFGITLNIGGFLVSGTLIGGQHYFEGFSDDFAGDETSDEAIASLKQAFAKYSNIYNEEKEDVQKSPRYIHLQGAKFFNSNGSPIPGENGVWWRGRVSEVSGFMLGSLSPVDRRHG